jgi:hypothetical protein
MSGMIAIERRMPIKGIILNKGNSEPICIEEAKSPEISDNKNTKFLNITLIIHPLIIDRGYFYSIVILF